MGPVDILVDEHELIKSFINIQWSALSRLKEDVKPSREFYEKSVRFIKTFADKFHHFKEEDTMFRMLAEKENGEIDAQVEILKHQHERGRNFVAKIASSIPGYAKGNEIAINNILENVAAYCSLLGRHIHMEDCSFFPLAEQELSEEEQAYLLQEFEKSNQRVGSNDFFNESKKLVEELKQSIPEKILV